MKAPLSIQFTLLLLSCVYTLPWSAEHQTEITFAFLVFQIHIEDDILNVLKSFQSSLDYQVLQFTAILYRREGHTSPSCLAFNESINNLFFGGLASVKNDTRCSTGSIFHVLYGLGVVVGCCELLLL